jgi:hypothetical protein
MSPYTSKDTLSFNAIFHLSDYPKYLLFTHYNQFQNNSWIDQQNFKEILNNLLNLTKAFFWIRKKKYNSKLKNAKFLKEIFNILWFPKKTLNNGLKKNRKKTNWKWIRS